MSDRNTLQIFPPSAYLKNDSSQKIMFQQSMTEVVSEMQSIQDFAFISGQMMHIISDNSFEKDTLKLVVQTATDQVYSLLEDVSYNYLTRITLFCFQFILSNIWIMKPTKPKVFMKKMEFNYNFGKTLSNIFVTEKCIH